MLHWPHPPSSWNSYHSFCMSSDVPPLPLYQQIFLFYVTFLAHHLSYKTIKVYLSCIQFCSNFMGLTEKISEMCQLFYVLHGIHRFIHSHHHALTSAHLNQIIHYVYASYVYHHD